MSTVVIVDSACELPDRMANTKSLKVLPINVDLGAGQMRDDFDSEKTLQLVKQGKLDPKLKASSDAATVEQIATFLKREILPNYNYAIVQTVSSKRSDQYDFWQRVNKKLAILSRQRGSKSTFGMTVIDTGTAFSGQALVALETMRLARQTSSRRELIQETKNFIPFLQAYTAPPDLGYLRRRAVQRGDNTMRLVDTLIGKALRISPVLYGMNNDLGLSSREKGHDKAIQRILDHALESIRRGLKSPLIAVSYAGPLQELEQQASYQTFKRLAADQGCKVFTSTARLSSMINLGPRNFGLALAPRDKDFVLVD